MNEKHPMARQLYFPEFEKLKIKDFGGSLIKGNPREARPLSIKKPIHLVMRSNLAKGEKSFLKATRAKKIESVLRRVARTQSIKIYRYANSGNHLHLVILSPSKRAFNRFIRVTTGLIARITLGVERGKALRLKFWDARPFTRILEWGKDFKRTCSYLLQNTLEALGFISYRKRSAKPG